MDMTPAEWWSAIGQVAVVVAISFVVLCLVTSLVRFQLMAEKAAETEELGFGAEKDFRMGVMNQIAAARKAREPISVVLLRLPPGGAPSVEVEARLRSALRATDSVRPCGENLIGLMLMCGSEKTGTVVRRLVRPDVAGNLDGAALWRFGVAGYPEHGFKTSALYPRALAMIDEAEQSGELIAGMAPREAVAEDSTAPADLVDPLTGLIREDKMIAVMRRFIAQERKAERGVSLAYFDVDQFDRLGEQIGPENQDVLIRELADFLGGQFREKDVLCRFGSSGFVVGLAAPPSVAMVAIQRISAAVRKHVFKTGAATKLSCSVGLAGYPDVQGAAVQYFVAAEIALQQARVRGRNQIVKYEPAMQNQTETDTSIDRL